MHLNLVGAFLQFFITIGILYAQIFGYTAPMMVYHFIMLAVPVTFGIVFLFMPETPVYLIRKGKSQKASQAFKNLRGKNYDPSKEVKAIEEQIAKEADGPAFHEAIRSKAAKKATLICFVLMFYQQLSGINAVVFYTKEIFIAAGSGLPHHYCVIIIGIIQVISSAFSVWGMDKLGRKVLLMVSCALVGLSCGVLGLFFTLKDNAVIDQRGVEDISVLPLTSLIIYIIFFCVGLGPIPWLASSEIFPSEVKAKCGSAAGTFNWFLAFLVTRFYLNVANAIGTDITFYIFGVIMLSGVVFVFLCVPETKGKSFEQIQSELGGM